MNIRVKINVVIELIVEFDSKIIFKRRKILKKYDAKIITTFLKKKRFYNRNQEGKRVTNDNEL